MVRPQRTRGPVVMFDGDPDDAYSVQSHESEVSDGGSYYSHRSRQSQRSRQSEYSRQSQYSRYSTSINPPEGYGLGRIMQRAVFSVFAMGLLCICLYPELVQQGTATGSVLKKEFVVKLPSKIRKTAAPVSTEAEEDLEDIDSLASLGFKTVKASSEPVAENEPRKTTTIVDDTIEDGVELDGETMPSIKINDSLSAKVNEVTAKPKTTERPTLEALEALMETLKTKITDESGETSTLSADALALTAFEALIKLTKANAKTSGTHEHLAVEEPGILVGNELRVEGQGTGTHEGTNEREMDGAGAGRRST
jgi:hypothetical protein